MNLPVSGNDLIRRSDAIRAIEHADPAFSYVLDCLETVEAEPVKYEHWVVRKHSNKPGNYICFCSGCKTEGSPIWKRCPVCEAKMNAGRVGNDT